MALGGKRIKSAENRVNIRSSIHYIIASCVYCGITVTSARPTTWSTRDSGNRTADDSDDVCTKQKNTFSSPIGCIQTQVWTPAHATAHIYTT
jgi:hypothetical protein